MTVRKKEVKTKRVKRKVYKKASDGTKAAVKKAIRRKKRKALTAAEKRSKLIVHNLITNPRSAFRYTAMPSDMVARKRKPATEVQDYDSTN